MRMSRKRARGRGLRHRLVPLICVLVMLASAGYVLHYEMVRRDILRRNADYSALYELPELEDEPSEVSASSAPTDAPPSIPASASPLAALSRVPNTGATTLSRPSARPKASPSPSASSKASPSPSANSKASLSLSAGASASPTPAPTPGRTLAIAVDATYTPRATAGANTLVYALETPPPAQHSFSRLLELNPETVGFLTIPNLLSLPVAQRPNDNDFYLTHGFDGEESDGGALFLDGANLLAPEDDCLIVYGHNMKNGTMFRPLVQYEKLDFLKEHPLVRFDTIYENRVYAPFAALTVTADPDSERYMNLRLFDFDEPGFDLFVRSLRTLSEWGCPLDVRYGDRLLLLVTCEYTHDNGRFVLALRERRSGERMDYLRSQVQDSR